MSERNENRPGYKKVRLGWIPKDWEYVQAKEISTLCAGGTPSTSNNQYWGGDILWMRSGDLNLRRISDVEGRITQKGLDYSSATLVPKHSVLIGLAGQGKTRGTVAVNEVILSTNQSVAAIIPFATKAYYLYLYYDLFHRYQEVRRLSTGDGGRGGLNLSILGNLYFKLPPLPEQCKIAEILGTWDRAIELVEKQIEAKQRLKKGLMQQLLTGKKRFPGFDDRWRAVSLKRVAKLLVSNVDKKSSKDEVPVVLCNYMDVYENEYITNTINFMPATASSAEFKKFALQVGDVILTKDSETREDIASTTVVTEIVNGLLCGYHLAILRPDHKQIDSIFLAKLLSHGRAHHHFVAHANGATRFGLTISAIENAKIKLPSLNEQKKIAEVFFTLDKEIEMLSGKIDILRRQKQGLMQKLLTGEVRVRI
jgi:type I restriction enzyme S subunit